MIRSVRKVSGKPGTRVRSESRLAVPIRTTPHALPEARVLDRGLRRLEGHLVPASRGGRKRERGQSVGGKLQAKIRHETHAAAAMRGPARHGWVASGQACGAVFCHAVPKQCKHRELASMPWARRLSQGRKEAPREDWPARASRKRMQGIDARRLRGKRAASQFTRDRDQEQLTAHLDA